MYSILLEVLWAEVLPKTKLLTYILIGKPESKKGRIAVKKYFNKVLPTLLVAALMLGTFQLVRSATPAEADVGGAGIAIGVAGIGTGLAQSHIGAAAVGAVADDQKNLVNGLIFVAIPETIVILGFVIANQIMG